MTDADTLGRLGDALARIDALETMVEGLQAELAAEEKRCRTEAGARRMCIAALRDIRAIVDDIIE